MYTENTFYLIFLLEHGDSSGQPMGKSKHLAQGTPLILFLWTPLLCYGSHPTAWPFPPQLGEKPERRASHSQPALLFLLLLLTLLSPPSLPTVLNNRSIFWQLRELKVEDETGWFLLRLSSWLIDTPFVPLSSWGSFELICPTVSHMYLVHSVALIHIHAQTSLGSFHHCHPFFLPSGSFPTVMLCSFALYFLTHWF